MAVDEPQIHNEDEAHLARLGYKQELSRTWSGFSNFAISFSIISILAGCFTTFGQAWNNGGPIAISWGWPIIAGFILIIGFTMSELVSAYPTSGGIYWWASKLGGPAAGFFTGWLNLIGLLAVTASVAYGCATFIDLTLDTLSSSWADGYSLTRVFVIFIVVLAAAAVLNIFSGHLMAVINNISVWWHVVGASIVVLVLVFVPKTHQGLSFVFTHKVNNSGYAEGALSGTHFWFLVLPLGFLLTQYTITGFDASAHLSEETNTASKAAAKGLWRSIFYSAIGGWILLLAFLFAVQDPDAVTAGGGGVDLIFGQALGQNWHVLVLAISATGQFYCTVACLTSASRMTFAFSRDGAIPGSSMLSRVTTARVPANAVIFVAVIGAIITLPALIKVDINGAPVPVAFYAVVSVAVIGLYLAFLIPIYLRWRLGDAFEPGSWTNGDKYKWMNLVAVAEIGIICIYFILPFTPAAIPGNEDFSWKFVNYAPILTIGSLVVLTIWWHASAKKWFTGPKHTIDQAVLDAFDD
ncbi:MAG TPA: amino acid permease [Nocardioides sp.]|uniref:amino acid permease n=1 Tax=uncultured Nocardioides sp. TaxID=198441 RepID=UPI000EC142D8|nr:amino acid permease [uncultured Nocardioides sp.]HCB05018.1 amino acid permease [Nocardioides sp.]HRD60705.1 amino acid permease [Nocardioides sp.]HRI94631.1 amino acid permease [Nocardioides sp.]HRK46363.1 amino acid permease [Nocardioides sp.]